MALAAGTHLTDDGIRPSSQRSDVEFSLLMLIAIGAIFVAICAVAALVPTHSH